MSSQNNKSKASKSSIKSRSIGIKSKQSQEALSIISKLALLGSQSELEYDPKTKRQDVFVNKSELASFKADSPPVHMDESFFKARGTPKELPSLLPLDKTLEGKIKFIRGSFTEKKNSDRIQPKLQPKHAQVTRPSFAINSKFEPLFKSGRKLFHNTKTSLFGKDLEFENKKTFKKFFLGKRSSMNDSVKKMKSLPLKVPAKHNTQKFSEKDKLKIITKKIIRSYKFNIQMAMNVFKKVCIINHSQAISKQSKSNLNVPKSFVLKLEESCSENMKELTNEDNETQTMKDLLIKNSIRAPPNSGLRKISISKSCRESRLWTQLLEKHTNDMKKKKRRRKRKTVNQSELFSFHKMEKTNLDASKVIDINGKFEFLDLSFKNINKEPQDN